MQSTLSPADRRAYEANLWRFVLIRVLGDLMLWFPIWVVYLQEMRGFSLTQVTLLEGPFWLAMVLAEVPTGAVADRWGRKLSLLLGGIVYAAAMVAFGTAETFGAIFISYLIWAVSSTLVSGADTAFLYESLRALGRGHELQRWLGRAYAGGVAATVAGVLIGAPLAAATSLATPIIASAAIAAIGVLVTLTLREPPHVLEDDGSGKPPAYHALIVRAARLTWHEPGLRSLVALRAVLFGAFILGVIFVQPFLTSFHVSIDQFGWLMALTRLAAIAGALVGARLVGHLGEGQVFVGATVVTVGSLVVLGLLPSLLAFAMFATLGFAQAVAAPAAQVAINRYTPDETRATVASFAQMAVSVLLAVAAPLLGLLADRVSLQAAFLAAGLGGAALAAPALVGVLRSPSTRTVTARIVDRSPAA